MTQLSNEFWSAAPQEKWLVDLDNHAGSWTREEAVSFILAKIWDQINITDPAEFSGVRYEALRGEAVEWLVTAEEEHGPWPYLPEGPFGKEDLYGLNENC